MKKLLLFVAAMLMSIGTVLAAINVNTANQKELESIKGIGPAKAKAIIDYRAKNGPFKSIDDLDKVKGVGTKTLAEIRPQVTLSGPSTPVAAAGKKAATARHHGTAPAGKKPGAGSMQPGAVPGAA